MRLSSQASFLALYIRGWEGHTNSVSVGKEGRPELKIFIPRVKFDLESLTLPSWDVVEQDR